MIETIIKLDGTEEPFVPSKRNKWSEWSSEEVRDRVDWSSIVMKAVKACGKKVSSQELQEQLIKQCVRKKLWPYSLMAGRLYNSVVRKKIYPFGNLTLNDRGLPTVKDLHLQLLSMNIMVDMGYTIAEYKEIENIIDHTRDMHMPYFAVKQVVNKYGLSDRTVGTRYETPQFVFMRMAMHLASTEPEEKRLEAVKAFYDQISLSKVNAPSPNYTNLGTSHNGYSSCCLYTVKDTAPSLAAGDHIAYVMTYMSSGIGSHINTRSVKDPVRGGLISHQGKYPYFESLAGAVKANLQGGRGGACTTYVSAFDPEIEMVLMAQNPRTPVDAQNRKIHFGIQINKLLAKKASLDQDIFLFNCYTAPDLHKALFSGDSDEFERLYNKYESDPSFEKKYVKARRIVNMIGEQREEVATLYDIQIDEINRHTSYKEPIYSSNLCVEVMQPTKPYESVADLYKTDDTVTGEVSTCNLAGIVVSNINNDEEYEQAAYYALKMIDRCIHMSHYELPHVGYTALRRLNAGVGILGLAYHLAKKGLKYDTKEGLEEIHRVAERHAYFVIRASLRLGKELGNAPWINKTKWPDGWLPIDTYKKNVDQIVNIPLQYDWETLRKEIVANGGIRNSSLIAHMPTESSSKASGAPNGVYPIRDLNLKKTDAENVLEWCAPDNDLLEDKYQLAWDIEAIDMLKVYAVIQKFSDQGISADTYRNRIKYPIITSEQILEEHRTVIKFGVKGRYYGNSYTVESNPLIGKTVTIVSPEEETSTNVISDIVKDLTHETIVPPLSLEEKLDSAAQAAMTGESSNSRGCSSGVGTL